MVAEETETNAHAAEEEWKRAIGNHHAQSVSATPAINLRPTTSGVEVHVRYITRAHERYAIRTRLYQELVTLLRRKPIRGEMAARGMTRDQKQAGRQNVCDFESTRPRPNLRASFLRLDRH